MSEFSNSYHLKSDNTQDAIALLTKSNLKGYVFPASNGWVTLVPEGEGFEPVAAIIERNLGMLVHYISAQDFGWAFTVYEGSQEISDYGCTWADEVKFEIKVEDSELDRDLLFKLVAQNHPNVSSDELAQKIKTMLYPDEESLDLLDDTPSYQFAELVGLKHTDWVSYDYISNDHDMRDELYPGVIFIDNAGTCS